MRVTNYCNFTSVTHDDLHGSDCAFDTWIFTNYRVGSSRWADDILKQFTRRARTFIVLHLCFEMSFCFGLTCFLFCMHILLRHWSLEYFLWDLVRSGTVCDSLTRAMTTFLQWRHSQTHVREYHIIDESEERRVLFSLTWSMIKRCQWRHRDVLFLCGMSTIRNVDNFMTTSSRVRKFWVSERIGMTILKLISMTALGWILTFYIKSIAVQTSPNHSLEKSDARFAREQHVIKVIHQSRRRGKIVSVLTNRSLEVWSVFRRDRIRATRTAVDESGADTLEREEDNLTWFMCHDGVNVWLMSVSERLSSRDSSMATGCLDSVILLSCVRQVWKGDFGVQYPEICLDHEVTSLLDVLEVCLVVCYGKCKRNWTFTSLPWSSCIWEWKCVLLNWMDPHVSSIVIAQILDFQ